MNPVTIQPIGIVRSARKIPEDDHWDAVPTFIELDGARFSPEALLGLDTFSHVQVIFLMDRVEPSKIETKARGQIGWARPCVASTASTDSSCT